MQDCCDTHGVLPSPVWGGVGGVGVAVGGCSLRHNYDPPPPTLPHKGGGSRPPLPLVLIPFQRHPLQCPDSEVRIIARHTRLDVAGLSRTVSVSRLGAAAQLNRSLMTACEHA